ncbi:lysozyme [Bacteroidia bacterium]|nr:lysozyme [Bacteroidia bacterium]
MANEEEIVEQTRDDKRFYKLPLYFDGFLEQFADTEVPEGVDFPTCSELESIDQHLGLILTTCPGEHLFNPDYGCGIWDMDFERVVSRQRWEDRFTEHILQAVSKFEKRLTNVTAGIRVADTVREDAATRTTAIKKKVSVQINGRLVSDDANCGFRYTLFLGPLTTE